MVRMGRCLSQDSHSSCRWWTLRRQLKGIPSSPSRCLILMRYRQSSGGHLRYTIPLSGVSPTILAHSWLQMSYSASSKLPSLCMSSPKTCLSARGDLSENRRVLGCNWVCWCQRRCRECSAWSWKVKAHRLGSRQQFLRMLPPDMLDHSSTGSLMVEMLSRERRVLLPAPRLPSMETTPDIWRQLSNQIDGYSANMPQINEQRLTSIFELGDGKENPLFVKKRNKQ